jgi:hypothetical protein
VSFSLSRDAHASRCRHCSFEVDPGGLAKTGVNGLIDALKKVREKMAR